MRHIKMRNIPSWSAPMVGTKPTVIEGSYDLRSDRMDSMDGWMIAPAVASLSLSSSASTLGMVDMFDAFGGLSKCGPLLLESSSRELVGVAPR